MRINDKLSINPISFGGLNQKEFLKEFDGKAPVEKLKAIHSECKKALKLSNK